MTTAIENENILRVLKEEPLVKVCVECSHFRWTNRCFRDQKIAFHSVTGKIEKQGEIFNCDVEREIDRKFSNLVDSGRCCGAKGQFWKQKEPEAPRWWQRWIKFGV